MTQGVVYQITCRLCKEDSKVTHYYGESARTGFDRGLEHSAALKNWDMESPLVEHLVKEHPNMGPQDDARQVFEMEVKSTHPRPLPRQCMEAHMIQGFKGNTILNRKGEWGQNLPPKLSIADEDLDKPEHPKRKRNVRQHQPLLQQDHVHEGEEESQQHPQHQPAESQRPSKRRKTAEDP